MPQEGSDKGQGRSELLVLQLLDTHEGHRVVAPGAHDAEALHHRVLHQGLGIGPQGLNGNVLPGQMGLTVNWAEADLAE